MGIFQFLDPLFPLFYLRHWSRRRPRCVLPIGRACDRGEFFDYLVGYRKDLLKRFLGFGVFLVLANPACKCMQHFINGGRLRLRYIVPEVVDVQQCARNASAGRTRARRRSVLCGIP